MLFLNIQIYELLNILSNYRDFVIVLISQKFVYKKKTTTYRYSVRTH